MDRADDLYILIALDRTASMSMNINISIISNNNNNIATTFSVIVIDNFCQ